MKYKRCDRMKKIAIITLTKNANYGNVLQNIALQKVLEGYGFCVETIINKTNSSLFVDQKQNIKGYIKYIINYKNIRVEKKKSLIFREFCQSWIHYSLITYNYGRFSSDPNKEYDYFVTGSDQVWNPMFGFASDFELLAFTSKNKKLSYSASFGISDFTQVPDEAKQRIIKGINNFQRISVREKSGKKFVDKYCDVDSSVHIDPTLLLSQNIWSEFARKPKKKIPSNYILVYMLGKNSANKYKEEIKRLARINNNAKMINLIDGSWRYIRPDGFVWLIKNATYVCTDSFHASVFSIIFHKSFRIFSRIDNFANQETRLISLCQTLDIPLTQVMYGNQNLRLDCPKIDWNVMERKLAVERSKAHTYLEESLHLQNDSEI